MDMDAKKHNHSEFGRKNIQVVASSNATQTFMMDIL